MGVTHYPKLRAPSNHFRRGVSTLYAKQQALRSGSVIIMNTSSVIMKIIWQNAVIFRITHLTGTRTMSTLNKTPNPASILNLGFLQHFAPRSKPAATTWKPSTRTPTQMKTCAHRKNCWISLSNKAGKSAKRCQVKEIKRWGLLHFSPGRKLQIWAFTNM